MSGGAGKVKATAQEKALANDAVFRWNEHQQNFIPMEDSFISSLKASDALRAEAKGEAVSDVEQAMKGKDQALVKGARGTVSQGKTTLARAGMSSAKGDARGEVLAGTDSALRTREMKGLTKMASFGRGLQDMNSLSMADAATTSTSNALHKLSSKTAGKAATISALGTFAGTAMGNVGTMESLKEQVAAKYGKKGTP